MFNRIIKRGNRKVPKSDASEPAVYPYGATAAGGAPVVSASNVTINHASRTTLSSSVAGAAPNSHPQASSGAATAAQIEALPLFRDVPVPERQALFLRKLQICAMVFDFSDTLKSAREKETKRQTLLELIDFIQSKKSSFVPAASGAEGESERCDQNLIMPAAVPPSHP